MPQRLFDKFGEALLESEAWPHALHKARPLMFDTIQRIERLQHCAVQTLSAGLLRKPDERRADQALELVFALDGQLQTGVANSRDEQLDLRGIEVGKLGKSDRNSSPSSRLLA